MPWSVFRGAAKASLHSTRSCSKRSDSLSLPRPPTPSPHPPLCWRGWVRTLGTGPRAGRNSSGNDESVASSEVGPESGFYLQWKPQNRRLVWDWASKDWLLTAKTAKSLFRKKNEERQFSKCFGGRRGCAWINSPAGRALALHAADPETSPAPIPKAGCGPPPTKKKKNVCTGLREAPV